MREKLNKIGVLLAVQIGLCLICVVIFMLYTYIDEQWRFFYHENINNFSLCNTDISVPEGNVIEIDAQSSESNHVIICGTLETSVPIDLVILVYKSSNEEPIVDSIFRDVPKGDFSFKIPLPEEDIAGNWWVEVRHGRKILATTEFTVITR